MLGLFGAWFALVQILYAVSLQTMEEYGAQISFKELLDILGCFARCVHSALMMFAEAYMDVALTNIASVPGVDVRGGRRVFDFDNILVSCC